MTRDEAVLNAYAIQGWMGLEELGWLYDRARGVNSIIEIGAWKGRSTYALAAGCSGYVTVIDHFLGSDSERNTNHSEALDFDIHAQFLQNTSTFPNIYVKRGDSALIAPYVSPAEMVFIDGDHTYEAVKRDIEIYRKKATRLVCGHDYDWDGVKQAVDEAFGDKVKQGAGSIWFVEGATK